MICCPKKLPRTTLSFLSYWPAPLTHLPDVKAGHLKKSLPKLQASFLAQISFLLILAMRIAGSWNNAISTSLCGSSQLLSCTLPYFFTLPSSDNHPVPDTGYQEGSLSWIDPAMLGPFTPLATTYSTKY